MFSPPASIKAPGSMKAEETLRFANSRAFKALLVLVAFWVVGLTILTNTNAFTGWHAAAGNRGNRGAFDRLDHVTLHTTEAQQQTSSLGSLLSSSQPHDTLITYVYSESTFGRENLAYFIQIGLHRAADFVFIFNGETDVASLLPDWDNICVVHRNNTCYDMGAVGEILRTDDLWKSYTKFININASLRGPFVPYWANSCWTDLYLNKLTDKVKFIGLTANCSPRPHVQSMIFATDSIGMAVLLDPEHATTGVADKYGTANDTVGLSGCYSGHRSAVHSEIGLATLIQNAGYSVDVMMAAFHQDQDEKTDLDAYCNATGMGDVLHNDKYFGFNIHPYETIFFKTNRKIDPVAIEKLTEWHLKRNVTAQTLCPAK